MPVIRPTGALPRFSGLLTTSNLVLNLSDEFKYATRVAWNVKIGPIKVLELDNASRWQVWKASVRELEHSLDGRLGGAIARADFRGRRRSFRYVREESVTGPPVVRHFIFFDGTSDFK
jgi:hypothetical protein